MVERASPVQLRKALELANVFVKMGINFVAVPVFDEEDQRELVEVSLAKLEAIEAAIAQAAPQGKEGAPYVE